MGKFKRFERVEEGETGIREGIDRSRHYVGVLGIKMMEWLPEERYKSQRKSRKGLMGFSLLKIRLGWIMSEGMISLVIYWGNAGGTQTVFRKPFPLSGSAYGPKGLSNGLLITPVISRLVTLTFCERVTVGGLASEVENMRYEEMMLDWLLAGECLEEEDEEEGLSGGELQKIHFFAEHPELGDPVIWFLPERNFRWGGGGR